MIFAIVFFIFVERLIFLRFFLSLVCFLPLDLLKLFLLHIYIYIFSKNFKRYSFCISFHTEGVFSRRWQSPPPLLNTHHGLAICITPKLCQHKLYSNGWRCSISPLDTLHLLNTLFCMDLCFKVTFIITKWSFTSIILWHFQ